MRAAKHVAGGLMAMALAGSAMAAGEDGEASLLEAVRPFVARAVAGFDGIPEARKKELEKGALFARSRVASGQEAHLNFICTHNSRRSHFSQVWAQVAAHYYGLKGVKTYSGGTEATACNPRTVAALRRAGLEITDSTGGDNPVYLVSFSKDQPPIRAFSKVYTAEGNPSKDFLALMTCSQADGSCPVVQGAALRLAVHYEDPKVADGTPEEAARYDERCLQIATEMFYMMSRIKG